MIEEAETGLDLEDGTGNPSFAVYFGEPDVNNATSGVPAHGKESILKHRGGMLLRSFYLAASDSGSWCEAAGDGAGAALGSRIERCAPSVEPQAFEMGQPNQGCHTVWALLGCCQSRVCTHDESRKLVSTRDDVTALIGYENGSERRGTSFTLVIGGEVGPQAGFT